MTVLNEIKIGVVIIPMQFEEYENYKKLKKIINEKNILYKEVVAGDKINIEEGLDFEVLWPTLDKAIKENSINNNSLVCKMRYKNISALFTGDIEEIAEKEILKKYVTEPSKLNANILKVAHHGSKSSSISEFIEKVNPQLALIGVGKENSFGHPSEKTLKTLENSNTKIYRTDISGEICIKYTKKGKIKTKEKVR